MTRNWAQIRGLPHPGDGLKSSDVDFKSIFMEGDTLLFSEHLQ